MVSSHQLLGAASLESHVELPPVQVGVDLTELTELMLEAGSCLAALVAAAHPFSGAAWQTGWDLQRGS